MTRWNAVGAVMCAVPMPLSLFIAFGFGWPWGLGFLFGAIYGVVGAILLVADEGSEGR